MPNFLDTQGTFNKIITPRGKIMKRKSGVLLHISSLPSGYGIGSLGRCAYEFVDLLYRGGFSVWQTLPFCMTDEYNSPYKSRASLGVNPYLIDLEILYSEGLITAEELEGAREKSPYLCEYERLCKDRLPLLRRASERIDKNSDKYKSIKEFIKANEYLSNVAKFLALEEKNDFLPWQMWKCHEPLSDTLFFYEFIQYEFFSEWLKIKRYANEKGIEIIGDLPFYVDLNSADVYFNPEIFKLDSKGYPTAVAGVPPDAFSEDGQLWGNPLYDFKKMKETGFAFFKTRLRHMLTLFDGVRIDHFRAIESYYSIPLSATAKEGKWVKGPGRALVDAIREMAGDKLIIAEDLGVITEKVCSLLKYSGFPGMRVLQFAFSEGKDNLHMPHNYNENVIAYTGTHDNNTTLGYVYEISEWERKRFLQYINSSGNDSVISAVKSVLRSSAGIAIIPIQDLLSYGKDTRMNTPGVSVGNWEYRVAKDQLSIINWDMWRELNILYGRKE